MATLNRVLDPRAAGAKRLVGKVAIVTGSGQGHGRATAKRLAEEGASIMVVDRFEQGGIRSRDELREAGVNAELFIGDVGSADTAKALMKATKDKFGKIDILVNNVGGAMYQSRQGWEFSPQELIDNVNNSLWTCLWNCWAVMSYMVEQRSGSIINFGSHAVRGTGRLGYAAAKGGVMAITTSLALEAAPYNVRVNCVVPHLSTRPEGDTLIARVPGAPVPAGGAGRDATKQLTNANMTPIPMNRPGTPEEVAAAVAFFASDDSSFTTAEIMCVGGGAFCQL
ncbi:MAG: SDR family oxidoreductase [SAR202 cluster bacterium]|nr:SDR family oxidoreductase [SAR202 cluster bacterium]